MESSKLLKEIKDWAASLGFTLPDGTAPPADFFALLTATPHRRQLWKSLVESIQPRQKIEQMRKQILVTGLRERRKHSTARTLRQITDRVDLWHKQNRHESEIKENRNAVVKLEKDILTKASDLMFEICKLSELEKLSEEVREKCVVLKLLNKRKKKLMEVFNEGLAKVKEDLCFDSSSVHLEDSNCMKNAVKCLGGDECKSLCKKDSLCESDSGREHLWEELLRCKGNLLEKFSMFLADSSEMNLLSEKESKIEKAINASVTRLKQKATEKSLQAMINSTNGKQLDRQLEKLEENLKVLIREPQERSFNETISFLNMSADADALKKLKNYLNVMGLERYREFLREEVKRLEVGTKRLEEAGSVGTAVNTFARDAIMAEVNTLESEVEGTEKDIRSRHSKLETLLQSVKEETEGKARAVEDAADRLKLASVKQVDLLWESPLDVFKTVESSSGGVPLERESASHLYNYVGELKQFFSAMLVTPAGDPGDIVRELERRKAVVRRLGEIIAEREKLAGVQRRIQQRMSCITYEREFCERNHNESDAILWNVVRRTEELFREVDFVEKVLTNWVEQPYRLMVKETS